MDFLRITRLGRRMAAAALLLSGSVLSVYGQFTWNGSGSNNNWSTGANWGGGAAPTSTLTTDLAFGGVTRLNPNLDSSRSARSITFSAGAGAFTLGGASTLTLGTGGVTNTSTSLQTLGMGVTLNGTQTWSANSGALAATGNINLGGNNFTVAGAEDTTLSGVISGGWESLIFAKSGSGTLTLSGNNTFGHKVAVNSGKLVVTHNKALGGSSYGNTIAAGGALHLQNNITVTEGTFSVAGAGVGGAGAIVNDSGNNVLNAQLNLGGATTLGSTSGTITLSQQINTGSGHALTVTGDGNFVFGGQIDGSGNLTTRGAGTKTFNRAVTTGGAVTFGGSGATTLNDQLSNATSLTITNSAATTFNAKVSSQSVNLTGTGAVNFNGNELNTKSFTNSGSGDVSVASKLNVDGPMTLSGSGNTLLTGVEINAKNLNITGTGTTTIAGNGNTNIATTSVTGGTLLLDRDSGTALSGNVTIGDGGTLMFGGDSQTASWTNLTLAAGSTVLLNNTDQSLANLTITGDTVIDFAGGGSSLTISQLNLAADATLTIINWSTAVDFFSAGNNPGSTILGEIVVNGNPGTAWNPHNGSITPTAPVPEPSTYGAMLIGAGAAFFGWRRWRAGRRERASRTLPPVEGKLIET